MKLDPFQNFVSRPCAACGRMLEPVFEYCGTEFEWSEEEKTGKPKTFVLMFICPIGKYYNRNWVTSTPNGKVYHYDSHGDVCFAKFDEERKVWVVDEESWT